MANLLRAPRLSFALAAVVMVGFSATAVAAPSPTPTATQSANSATPSADATSSDPSASVTSSAQASPAGAGSANPSSLPTVSDQPSGAASTGTDQSQTLTGNVIVKFKSDTAAADSLSKQQQILQTGSGGQAYGTIERQLATGSTLVDANGNPQTVAKRLSARSDVAYAVPDLRIHTASAPNDPLFSYQWDLQNWNLSTKSGGMDAINAWTRSKGSGVRVAVLDTGKTAHPDLAGQFIGGYDFISDPSQSNDGDGRDANPTDPGDYNLNSSSCDISDSSWHGTHVAGTIAALQNNHIGVSGLAPLAKIVPVRVLGRCGGTESDLDDAIVWAAGGQVHGAPSNPYPAKVLNLSLSGQGACSAAAQDAINVARARGAIIIVAAGNDGTDASGEFPANCQGVISVAATGTNGMLASYSDHTSVTLAAPGGDVSNGSGRFIWSTYVDDATTNTGDYTYAGDEGTSMAAPHVAAVAALAWSLDPALTAAQVTSILIHGVRNPSPCTLCGAGLLDADLALGWIPTIQAVSPASVPLWGQKTITIRGFGLGHVTQVTVGGVAATNVQVVNSMMVTAVVPAHTAATTYAVAVSNAIVTSQASTAARLAYRATPTINSISPASGAASGGTKVTITGTGFVSGVSVTFGTATASSVSVSSSTSLVAVAPKGTKGSYGVVRITSEVGTSSAVKNGVFHWT